MIKKDYMGLDYCTELNDLRIKLIYAKDFNPQSIPYWQQNIAEHIKQCPFLLSNGKAPGCHPELIPQ